MACSLFLSDRFKVLYPVFAFLLLFILNACSSAQTAPEHKVAPASNARYIPEGYQIPAPPQIIVSNDDINCSVYSRLFAQGDAAYIEIEAKRNGVSDIKINFNTVEIPVTKRGWGYRAFFAIPPESKPGEAKLIVRYSFNGSKIEKEILIKTADAKFKVFRQALDLGVYSDEGAKLSDSTLRFIEECDKKKKTAFAEIIPDQLTSSLAHPRNMHYITSDFYSKRVYMRYINKNKKKIKLKDKERIHYGLDLRGEEGSPVYAIAAGKVALADPMYYEGNFVLINHGEGIFSYYMHQSKLLVKQGDIVNPGQQIGEVGTTGASTGPHLHISLKIHGIMADPLSMLCLPIRE